jgi:Ran GTPase-activating protein (RanGAP) involved in mRNA processing and transport
MSELLLNFNHLLNYRSREQLLRMNDCSRQQLLQELLAKEPVETGWLAICELYASWADGSEKANSLRVANQALEQWSDRLRHCSSSWRFLYDNKGLSSLAILVRSIDFYRREENGSRELWETVNSELAQNLKYLTIFRSEITSTAVKSLVNSPYLTALHSLEIRKTVILPEAVEHLLQAKGLPNLRVLKLVEVGLAPGELRWIRQSIPFTHLESIDFSVNFLKSEGLALLAQAPWFASIQTLEMRENGIRDDGANALVKSPYINALKLLDLSKNFITESGRKILIDKANEKEIELVL